MDKIKYIIEALRQKPTPEGVEKVNGRPRRMAGPLVSDQYTGLMQKNSPIIKERIIKDASE